MSPKMCSLAFDDVAVQEERYSLENEGLFDPKLEVIVSKKRLDCPSRDDQVVQVRGRINVSF